MYLCVCVRGFILAPSFVPALPSCAFSSISPTLTLTLITPHLITLTPHTSHLTPALSPLPSSSSLPRALLTRTPDLRDALHVAAMAFDDPGPPHARHAVGQGREVLVGVAVVQPTQLRVRV